MTHHQKVRYLIEEMARRGVSPHRVAPPLYRFLWLLGIEMPPPHFLSFSAKALFSGSTIAGVLFLGLFLYGWEGRALTRPFLDSCLIALTVGTAIGMVFAGYYQWSARRLRLPPWDRYPHH